MSEITTIRIQILGAEGFSLSGNSVHAEIARDDGRGERYTTTTQQLPSPCWNETFHLPVDSHRQTFIRVSLREGDPLTEEALTELAFAGNREAPPLGWARISLSDARVRNGSQTFDLQGTAADDDAAITLRFAFDEEDIPSKGVTGTAAAASATPIDRSGEDINSPTTPLQSNSPSSSFTPARPAVVSQRSPSSLAEDDDYDDDDDDDGGSVGSWGADGDDFVDAPEEGGEGEEISDIHSHRRTDNDVLGDKNIVSKRDTSQHSDTPRYDELRSDDSGDGGSAGGSGNNDGGAYSDAEHEISPLHGPESGAGLPVESGACGMSTADGGGGDVATLNRSDTGSGGGREEGEDKNADGVATDDHGKQTISAIGVSYLTTSGSESSDEDVALDGYPGTSGRLAIGAPTTPQRREPQGSESVAAASGVPQHGGADSPNAGHADSSGKMNFAHTAAKASNSRSSHEKTEDGGATAGGGGIAGGDFGGGHPGDLDGGARSIHLATPGGRTANWRAGRGRGRTSMQQTLQLQALVATVAATVEAVAQETVTSSIKSGFSPGTSSSSALNGSGGKISNSNVSRRDIYDSHASSISSSRSGTSARASGAGAGARKALPLTGSSPRPGQGDPDLFSSQGSHANSAEQGIVDKSNTEEIFEGSLPMAGSKSPPQPSPRPGRYEPDPVGLQVSVDGRLRRGGRLKNAVGNSDDGGDSSDDDFDDGGFVGSLPLAGSRSPVVSPSLPGRRVLEAVTLQESVDGSLRGGARRNTFARDDDDSESGGGDDFGNYGFTGSLPLAGSRSPGVSPRLPGRREPDSDCGDDCGDDDTEDDGFMGSLPLAGSRSPAVSPGLPERRKPKLDREDGGRRGDDIGAITFATSDQVKGGDHARIARQQPLPLRVPRVVISPRRGRPRPQKTRRGDDHIERHRTSAAKSTPASFSEASSAPLDLLSALSGSLASDQNDVLSQKAARRRRRPRSPAAPGSKNKSSTHDRVSFSSYREGANSDSSAVRATAATRRKEGRRKSVRQAATAVGTNITARPLSATIECGVAGRRRKTRGRSKNANGNSARRVSSAVSRTVVGGFQRRSGDDPWEGRNVAEGAAATRGGDETGFGVRSTHFAPGYLGVAWPDPTDGCATAQESAEAQARIVCKLERAAAKKLRELDERTRKTRQAIAERRKRRNLLLEQNTRQGIQDMVKEQERRLQRQLNAARRRQADAAAGTAVAGAATTATSRVALSPYDPNARQARIQPAVDEANVDPSARRVERANEVRRRRARLQAEEARSKVEALQRKGELRAQALWHTSGIVKSGQWDGGAGKDHDGGGAATAAVTAFAGAAADGGSGGGALRQAARKGVIIGSGPPRCNMKSWSEQRRNQVDNVRLTAEVEEAFRTLTSVAELRRQGVMSARRDRARESNARADEAYGRASKRRRMQKKNRVAELTARAREAQAAAVRLQESTAAAGEEKAHARGRSRSRGKSIDRGHSVKSRGRVAASRVRSHDDTGFSPEDQRSSEGRAGEVSRDDGRNGWRDSCEGNQPPTQIEVSPSVEVAQQGREQGRARGDRDAHERWEGRRAREVEPAGRETQCEETSNPLSGSLGEGKEEADGEKEGGSEGEAEGGNRRIYGPGGRRSSSGRMRGRRDKFWIPSGESEDVAMRLRLQHLDELTARLEETEAGLGEKLDRMSRGDHYPRSSVGESLSNGHDLGQASYSGRSKHRGGTSLGRGGETNVVSRGVGRLAAPTISSKLKVRPVPVDTHGGGGSGGSGGGRASGRKKERVARVAREKIARTEPTPAATPDVDKQSKWSRAEAKSTSAGLHHGSKCSDGGVGDQEVGSRQLDEREFEEERKDGPDDNNGGYKGARRGQEEAGSVVSGGGAGIRSKSERRVDHRANARPRASGTTRGEQGEGASAHGRQVMRSGADNRDRTKDSAREDNDNDAKNEDTSEAYYDSGDHAEALESVSKEAVRMREIKDDLTNVLRRLQEGDRRSATANPPPERHLFGGNGQEFRTGSNETAATERAIYGENFVSLDEEKVDHFSALEATAAEPRQPPTSAVSLQASALADLEARIASLGGLLDGYSSGDSSFPTPSQLQQQSPASPRSPSISPMPSPRESCDRQSTTHQTQKPFGARSAIDDEGNAEAGYDFSRDGHGDPFDHLQRSSHSRPSSASSSAAATAAAAAAGALRSTSAFAPGASPRSGGRRGDNRNSSISASSPAASIADLAREVETLLRSTGMKEENNNVHVRADHVDGVGGYHGGFDHETNTRSAAASNVASGGISTGVEIGVRGFGSPAAAVDEDGSVGSGWQALEGMAERLGNLVGEGDAASEYTSVVASVSSPGNTDTGDGFHGLAGSRIAI